MGTVYQAIDERLNTIVAVKETTAESERLRQAFKREASLLANLHHPALPAVKDHFNEGNRQYIVMEFIPGKWRFLLTRSKPTEIIEVTFY